MQGMPGLLEVVWPHTQLGTTGQGLNRLQFNCAVAAAAVRLGKAVGRTKPSQLRLAR